MSHHARRGWWYAAIGVVRDLDLLPDRSDLRQKVEGLPTIILKEILDLGPQEDPHVNPLFLLREIRAELHRRRMNRPGMDRAIEAGRQARLRRSSTFTFHGGTGQ